MSVAYVAYSPSGTHPSVAEQKQTSPASYADFSDAELDLMRRIKTTFDPNGILNPGKIFPDD